MLLKQVRTTYWKKWATTHECEELSKGVWLALMRAVLRDEKWTDKHRNVMRKLVVEGGWVQKRLYDIGWSDEKKCRGCNKRRGYGEALPILE